MPFNSDIKVHHSITPAFKSRRIWYFCIFNAIVEYLTILLMKRRNEDQSKIVKKSLIEMYENISDLKEIEKFEKKEKADKSKFFSVDDMFIEKS